ncbi:E3 ubiquitin-protein ligase ATL23 [Cocos nucifera]|uniref:E3 ubiquitin-protein ligase ATL23 n=1 Tax=Cocos nucifera TaxID=13894 RepID=A0A8K0I1M6_COCNU|nr:E3 ubiquitin-protein ligase ATL23 [Cocos nucifera]
MCKVWSAALREEAAAAEALTEKAVQRGLTAEDLERLEEGKMAVSDGGDCAVCLEEMEEGQAARVLPGCRHAFHRSCADAWLQVHPACPLCRAPLRPPPPPSSQPQPQSPPP